MPKYRLLTIEELQALEKEFVEYLAVNGIGGPDWQNLKRQEPEKADRIVELFSDVVFEGTMRKVRFLEFRSEKMVQCFQCLDEKLVLVALEASPMTEVDFTDASFIQRAVDEGIPGLKVFTTEKPYGKTREVELFDMVQAGCQVADGQLFKALLLAHTESGEGGA